MRCRRRWRTTTTGFAAAFIVLSSGCDTAGARPTLTAAPDEQVGTTAVADEGCTFTPPFALDAWATSGAGGSLVVHAHVIAADPPVHTATQYGEYVTQRLRLEDVETIFSSGTSPGDTTEVVVLVRPVDQSDGPAPPVAVDDLVRAPSVIINAYTDADDPTLLASAAAIGADGSVRFLGFCAEGSAETLATMMDELPDADGRSERDVLVDWLRTRHDVTD